MVRRVESHGVGTAFTIRALEGVFTILEPSGSSPRAQVDTGVANLLKKPFTAGSLAARIHELIAGKLQGDERG